MVKIMKSNYTLRELKELKETIKDEIAEILLDKCKDNKWYTARELEALTGGLGSCSHFTGMLAPGWGWDGCDYETNHFSLHFDCRKKDRVKKCAYLNDEGEIIGTFEIHDKPCYEYKLIRK